MAHRKLKVLMLGWEFPPHITGGLGTACEGLSNALAHREVEIYYLMPRLFGDENAPYMHLGDLSQRQWKSAISSPFSPERTLTLSNKTSDKLNNEFESAPLIANTKVETELEQWSRWFNLSGYATHAEDLEILQSLKLSSPRNGIFPHTIDHTSLALSEFPIESSSNSSVTTQSQYGSKIYHEIRNYIHSSLIMTKNLEFDLIHGHDWMTYPAALELARVHNKPVVVHVHSIETDRSPNGPNFTISAIEKAGIQAATSVIAVSHYTKNKIINDYHINSQKIQVVHNGVSPRLKTLRPLKKDGVQRVVFLGRLTSQKGPDYFVEAALSVLQHLPKTQFVLAGSGDMLPGLLRRIQTAGVEKNFLVPGFLRGQEVDEMLASADAYVMPSVSEPFGISALEAIYHDVPTIISRQSGVSEVLNHALKSDFWDINELADLIVGILKYPALRSDLVHMSREEVKHLNWHRSARNVETLYRNLILKT